MSKKITIENVINFIENDASHSDINDIWEKIKDEVVLDVEYFDVENYISWDASEFEKRDLFEQLKGLLGYVDEDVDEDGYFNIKTLDDYYKLKVVKEVFDKFTSEEFEQKLKRKIL